MIQTKRIYEPPSPDDGPRFLVERLWPRGIKKESGRLDAWLKDAAPSQALRAWYAHDLAKWEEFRRRYTTELDAKPETWLPILETARRGNVTLVYSARDTEHNSARVLLGYLERHLAAG